MKNLMIKSTSTWCTIMMILVLIGFTSCSTNEEKKTTESKPEAPQISIHEAALLGNINVIQAHITAMSNLNEKDAYGSAPLTIAATFGKTEIAKLLIKAGADVNIKGGDGSTPLHTSSFFCRTEIVAALLDAGAEVKLRNNYGSTALESVSTPFKDVKIIYDQISTDLGPLGLKLDYRHLEETRPLIVEMINEKSK